MHQLLVQNCHSHVALALNEMAYDGRTDWNQMRVAWAIWRYGRFVNRSQWAHVFGPALVLVAIVVTAALLSVKLA